MEANASNRKRNEEPDVLADKRLEAEQVNLLENSGSKHQEPEGIRKSRRIAGSPTALSTLPLPRRRNRRTIADANTTPLAAGILHALTEPDESMQIAQASAPGQDYQAPYSTPTMTRDFLHVLASNIARHKFVRRISHARYLQIERAAEIEVEDAEITGKQCKIREMQLTTGTQQEDLKVMKAIEDLRSQHARNRIELEQVNTNELRFEGPLSCLNAHHTRRTALRRALDDARDDQCEEEAILHRIAEEAVITAGLLAAGLQVEEVEFMRQIPSGNQESKRPKAMEPRLLSFYQAELADNVKRTSHNLLRAQRKQAQ